MLAEITTIASKFFQTVGSLCKLMLKLYPADFLMLSQAKSSLSLS